jgi:hypothetical protein
LSISRNQIAAGIVYSGVRDKQHKRYIRDERQTISDVAEIAEISLVEPCDELELNFGELTLTDS